MKIPRRKRCDRCGELLGLLTPGLHRCKAIHKRCGGRIKSTCFMAMPLNYCKKCGKEHIADRDVEFKKKKPMDPEKRRKLMMWAYAITMAGFLALTVISASLFARGLNNLVEMNSMTVESLAEAENLTFPLNETRTNRAIALHAFFAPMSVFITVIGLVFTVWFASWTLRMTGEFLRLKKRRPSDEDLNKFLEELYVRNSRKKKG